MIPPCTSQSYIKPEPKTGAKAIRDEFSQTLIHSMAPADPSPEELMLGVSAGSVKSIIPQS